MIAPELTRLWKIDARTLGLEWADGVQVRVDVVALRRACPCALCVSELTGERVVADQVGDDVRPTELRPVGRHALGVTWSDGHRTGMYALTELRAAALAGGLSAAGVAPVGPGVRPPAA